MDANNDASIETQKPLGIRASSEETAPVPHVEPILYSVRSDTGSQTDISRASRNVRLLIRKENNEHTIILPSKITSHTQFVRSISRIQTAVITPRTRLNLIPELCNSAYYVLAWLIGDATKKLGSKRKLTGHIGIELCCGHPENLELGVYVAERLRMFGIECTQRSDRPPDNRDPHGQYRWLSVRSPIVGWLYTSCLGLGWNELTSYHPVRMDWLLSAPRICRLWFIRGLFDSDGTVHFRNKEAEIISSPNSKLIMSLLDSLKVRNRLGNSKGYDKVIISIENAARIQVFNPNVATHRRKALERLVSAKTFQRHWPEWLQRKVDGLIRKGLDDPVICHRIFDEDKVYIKTKTVKIKRSLLFS
jgi:hypothetical protein